MKRLLSLLLALVMLLAFAACGESAPAPTSPAATPDAGAEPTETVIDPIKLTYANVCSTGSIVDQTNLAFIEKVKELSNSAIEIDYFPDAVLGSEGDNQASLQTGALDLCALSSSFSTLVPAAGVFELPYLINDRAQLDTLQDAGALQPIYDGAAEQGIIVISYGENGFRHMTNSVRPINAPEDLSGLKIRTPNNNLRMATFQALQANPSPISFSELYSALSSNVVDGQENPLAQIYGSRFYECQKYLSITGHVYSLNYICVSKLTWDNLTEAQQNVLTEAGKYAQEINRQLGEEADNELIAKLEEAGMEVNYADAEAFRTALMPLWDEFGADIGEDYVAQVKAALGY